jgi:hypothetical protein
MSRNFRSALTAGLEIWNCWCYEVIAKSVLDETAVHTER